MLNRKSRPAPKRGPVFDSVVLNFHQHPEKREWKASEIIEAVSKVIPDLERKAVYNVLGYLCREGRVTNKEYGRYLVNDGIALITLDRLDGVDYSRESTRDED